MQPSHTLTVAIGRGDVNVGGVNFQLGSRDGRQSSTAGSSQVTDSVFSGDPSTQDHTSVDNLGDAFNTLSSTKNPRSTR